MNNLTVFEQNGQLLTDSREVAMMVGKDHAKLLRDIKGYVKNQSTKTVPEEHFHVTSAQRKDAT